MAIHLPRSLPAVALSFATVIMLAACAPDSPTGLSSRQPLLDRSSTDSKVSVCHDPQAGGNILEVGAPAVRAHIAHGDYITTLVVNHDATQSEDGVHFPTIGAALAAARASRLSHDEVTTAACRITIAVAPGTYHGATSAPSSPTDEQFPLLVDFPDITLHGALAMTLDDAGRATGAGSDGSESVLAPSSPLPVVNGASTPLIVVNAHPDSSAGNEVVVEGLVFQSGHAASNDAGGQGLLAVRAQDLVVRGNRFEAGFTESIDLRASSASVTENYLSGTAGSCDVCLAGPGRYSASSNRLLAGGIPGITVSGMVNLPYTAGVEPMPLPVSAETWADVRNNEVRDHLRPPVGTGLRVEAVGTGAPNVHNTIHAVIQDNLLVNNRFGMIVHGGFPLPGTDRRGDVDVTLGGNVIEQSCQAKLLVALTRHQRALGIGTQPYLLNSTFAITLGGDLSWDEAWYGHAAGFGNTLTVDGAVIDNGGRQFYSTTSCPGLP